MSNAAPYGGSRMTALADAGWLRALIGLLAVLSMVTLVATMTAVGTPNGSLFAALHAASAACLFIALGVWLVASRMALTGMRVRDRAWQQSIDSMDVGIALYGPDDRLLNCNPAFRALYPEIADLMQPGAVYMDLVCTYYERAPAEVIDGRSREQFLNDSNRRRSGSQVTETVQHAGGRWLLMTDCRTAEGGIISFRRDVTEQKLIEHELSHRRRLMDDLAELTYDWFWRQDADGRFIEFSSTMERFVNVHASQLLGRKRTEMPGFEADPTLYAEYCERVAKREPFPWFTYKTRRGDGKTSPSLFNTFQREKTVVSANVARDVAQSKADDARRAVVAQFTQQLAALQTAFAKLDITTSNVAAATEDLRVQQERYRVGASTILDILTSEASLTQALTDQVQARFLLAAFAGSGSSRDTYPARNRATASASCGPGGGRAWRGPRRPTAPRLRGARGRAATQATAATDRCWSRSSSSSRPACLRSRTRRPWRSLRSWTRLRKARKTAGNRSG